ncbi:MAG: TetR/AcrR family transcriptional regulator [Desulfobacterales bacterium]|nr:TetR/AcrR family transcriptional regulator [Desulfobacterales bacterium]
MGRKSKTIERQAEILEHLIHMLNKEGLEGTSLSKISSHMGVNKSLLAHYFKSKDEMMVALVDNIIDRYKQTYKKMFEGVEEPKERLEIFLNTLISLDWEIGDEISDIVFYSCFYLRFRNDRISSRLKKLYEYINKVFLEEIMLYKENGIINVEDPEEAATFILTLGEGCYYYSTVMGDKVRDKKMISNMKKLARKVLISEQPLI